MVRRLASLARTRLVLRLTIALLAVALFLLIVSYGSASWFQYLLAMVIWDLARTAIQTWYLQKKLDKRPESCPYCNQSLK